MARRHHQHYPPCFAYVYGPVSDLTITAAMSWTTVDVATIGEESGGFGMTTAGELWTPAGGVFEISGSADGDKTTTGSALFQGRIQTDQSGSFATVMGTSVQGSVNGQNKGGQAVFITITRLDAGKLTRIQVLVGGTMDVNAGGMRFCIKRIAA